MKEVLKLCSLVILAWTFASMAEAGSPPTVKTEKVLYSFKGGDDGASPYAGLIFDSTGNLYGTTTEGGGQQCSGLGVAGCGVVFELTPGSGGSWTENVIHVFNEQTDGGNPYDAPVFDSSGTLYGTTLYYGAFGSGTAWELSPASGGTWSESILHSFHGTTDGLFPYGLNFDPRGHLYGTTSGGGANDDGLVFQLVPRPTGHWADQVLYNFMSGTDGDSPAGVLTFDAKGNIYGTTYVGGPHLTGTVFELSKRNETAREQILYTFQGLPFGSGPDGTNPTTGMVFDSAGNLYGTTSYGGESGVGTVYELSPDGNGTWTESVIYTFTDGTDGGHPGGLLIDQTGNLYGATSGHNTLGSVYELARSSGGQWNFTVLHDFEGPDGASPEGSLVMDQAGDLYGTTAFGGENDNGVVFEVAP
jgi:uncharacterized repeat protein (TIGR03803 family)